MSQNYEIITYNQQPTLAFACGLHCAASHPAFSGISVLKLHKLLTAGIQAKTIVFLNVEDVTVGFGIWGRFTPFELARMKADTEPPGATSLLSGQEHAIVATCAPLSGKHAEFLNQRMQQAFPKK